MDSAAGLWGVLIGEGDAAFLPGFALPAAITLLAVVLRPKELAKYWRQVLLCMALNLPYVVFQGFHGWGGGLLLAPFFAYVVVSALERRDAEMTPLVAFGAGWASLVPPDLVGAAAEPYFQGAGSVGLADLARVGGMGWLDALLLYPAAMAAIAALPGLLRAFPWRKAQAGD